MIKVEKTDDAIPGAAYPRLVRAIGARQPDYLGGLCGYADLRDTMADPAHEADADIFEWYGNTFDPEGADIDRILDNFECIALKRAPQPLKSKPPAKLLRSR